MIMSLKVLPTEQYFAMVRQMLSDNSEAYVRVTGNSMWPLLRHLKDSVVIVPPDNLRKGDIVLFDRCNGRYALHRAVQLKKTGFTMSGDNQPHVEYSLPYDQVVGKVTRIRRGDTEYSVEKFSFKIYFFAASFFSIPRMYLHQAVQCLKRPLRRLLKRYSS